VATPLTSPVRADEPPQRHLAPGVSRPERTLTWLLLAPAVLLYLVAFVLPQAGLLTRSVYPDDALGLGAYAAALGDGYAVGVVVRTMAIGGSVALGCLVLGFPLAYQLARSTSRWRSALLGLTVFPLLTSAVVRTFGWQVLFYEEGLISGTLRSLGMDGALIGTNLGVVIALTEVLLPFMVLTLFGVIRGIPTELEDAAQDLGDSPAMAIARVTVPMARSGIVGGTLLVFSLAVSSYVTPALVGGARVQVLATSIYEQAISLVNYPNAAALAVVLLAITTLLAVAQSRVMSDSGARR
jgi:ABC-type spermidine/putrescine transport system permease subunit I